MRHSIFLSLLAFVFLVKANPDGANEWVNPGGDKVVAMSEAELQNHMLALVFLGTHNGKNWYIDRVTGDQQEANRACTAMGLRLAQFANITELEFIYNKTATADEHIWTAAQTRYLPGSFYWRYNDGNFLGTAVGSIGAQTFDDITGLTFRRSSKSLTSKLSTLRLPFLCTL